MACSAGRMGTVHTAASWVNPWAFVGEACPPYLVHTSVVALALADQAFVVQASVVQASAVQASAVQAFPC